MDHTITDISRGADVARPTVYKVLDDLTEEDVVVETRRIGNSRLFQLNLEKRVVHDLLWVIEPEIDELGIGDIDVAVPEDESRSHPGRGHRSR